MAGSQPASDAYFDPRTDELVLRNGGKYGSSQTYKRYRLPRQPDPEVHVEIRADKDGVFTYTYRLLDAKPLAAPTGSISILLPGGGAGLDVTGAWPSKRKNTTVPDRLSLRTGGTMVRVRWSNPNPGSRAAAELHLVSTRLPGFTNVVIKPLAAIGLPDSVLSNLEPASRAAVERLLSYREGRRMAVLAPMFSPGTDKRMIAASFHYGISSLAGHGVLNREGKFVRDLLPLLDIAVETGVPPLAQMAALEASNFTEQQVRAALLLAFK